MGVIGSTAVAMVTGQMSKGWVLTYILTLICQTFPTFLQNDPPTAPERKRTYKAYTILESKHPGGRTLKRWA